MDRRQFLGWVGIGALASSLPVVIAACSQSSEPETSSSASTTTSQNTTPTSTPTTEGFVTVGTPQDVAEKGSIVNKELNVIVVATGENSFSALNSACTHKGCQVEWKSDSKNLVCPCHDSQFATDGKVLKGPATEPLKSYEVKEEEGKILVKVS